MKKTKFSRFFETLIYFILLTIPLISVFARTIYVQANPNAKDSYTGGVTFKSNVNLSTLVNSSGISFESYTQNDVTNYSYSNDTIYGSYVTRSLTNDNRLYTLFFVDNLEYNGSKLDYTFNAVLFTQYNNNWNVPNVLFYQLDTTILYTIRRTAYNPGLTDVNGNDVFPVYQITFGTSNYYGSDIFTFNLTNSTFYVQDTSNNLSKLSLFTLTLFVFSGSLDNAFDYGLQKTIDDFGHGNINFTSWFGTLFSNNTNLLYINFVNMYLNYALWVSVSYLLYYFLNWFIRFVRETLDNLIYKETKN